MLVGWVWLDGRWGVMGEKGGELGDLRDMIGIEAELERDVFEHIDLYPTHHLLQ